MAEVRYTHKAVEDLTDIWNYTADVWSERQADDYYEMLVASCRKIADNPERKLGEGIYGFKVNRHIVFYRILSDEIEVVRILHERMDLSNRFAD